MIVLVDAFTGSAAAVGSLVSSPTF